MRDSKHLKHLQVKIKNISKIKNDVFLISFTSGHLAKTAVPGQFLHVKVRGTLLRRPFSIHKVEGNDVFILFRLRGRGTKILSQYKKGGPLDLIGPLGNGFIINPPCGNTQDFLQSQATIHSPQNILVAGGMGVAPLVFLAQKLRKVHSPRSIVHRVLLGARNKSEILCEKQFKDLGFKVDIATEDGSRGHRGTTVGLLKKELSAMRYPLSANIYVCGPAGMFFETHKVIRMYSGIRCQVSFEQFMGCGLGVCCGCTIETRSGYKKVCKDGPVFDITDIYPFKENRRAV